MRLTEAFHFETSYEPLGIEQDFRRHNLKTRGGNLYAGKIKETANDRRRSVGCQERQT